ncbi:SIS domain-containing protein [Amnibacterium sp. CER49]|uniref:SIS domain-containing protein n=1 Tax=Amnibacterium sp. CER49 TaxID=3039161 RepID=UPI00244B989B|nr:SIS domain-containing protein [Amnibacterium sp. CER49]MDH2442562.1 SIS domain-containing protein [Amnibacterium sp. CER49]
MLLLDGRGMLSASPHLDRRHPSLRRPSMTDTTIPPAHVGVGTATEREISQQPDVWRETGRMVAGLRTEIEAFLAPLLAEPDLRIVLTGAGTSAFVGEVAAPALARRLRRRVDAVATTDLVSDPLSRLAEDVPTLLVSFARSGNSPESLGATDLADRVLSDVHHLVITCDPVGQLYTAHEGRARSRNLVTPRRANDEGFAMTSSFSSMLLTALLVFLGDDEALVEALATAGEQVLEARDRVQRLVERDPARIVYLGSGSLTGLARESALKVLEVTAGRVDTYFDSSLGFRHGPKAVLDDRTLAVVYGSNDPYIRRYDDDMTRELRAALGGASVQALSAGRTAPAADFGIDGVEGVDDAFLALPFAVFAQLIALHASVRAGVPTDNPFPGGAVNRVVQGVTIHPLEGR